MKFQRLGFFALFFIAACGQQSALELAKDQVFSKQFPAGSLVLNQDDGSNVKLTPRKLASSSAKGFTSTSPSDVYGGCNSWYGCQQQPYSYYTSYSNYAHAWNPAITRTVNMSFGRQQNGPPVIAAFDPFAVAVNPQGGGLYCINVNISSNQTIQVLQFNANDGSGWGGNGQNRVTGNYSNTVNITAQVQYNGAVVFSLQDMQSLYSSCGQQQGYNYGWQPSNWWDFGYNGGANGYGYTSCGAASARASLKITGTAGPCGAPKQVNLDLSAQVNSQQGYDPYSYYNTGYNMPYFSDNAAGIWGRVIQYQGNQGLNFYGL